MSSRAPSSEADAEVTPLGIDGSSRHAGYGGSSMRSWRRLLVATVGGLRLVGAGSVSVAAHEGGWLVEFDPMAPLTGAPVGAVNDRAISGGGLSGAITAGGGEGRGRGRR